MNELENQQIEKLINDASECLNEAVENEIRHPLDAIDIKANRTMFVFYYGGLLLNALKMLKPSSGSPTG